MAFDVSLGCSGYVYGLSIMSSLMASGQIGKGLLIVGDTSSFNSYRDKTTFPLFGDAGTVTALEYKEQSPAMFFNLQTDGSNYEAIIVRGGGARMPPDKKLLTYKRYGKGIIRNDIQPSLDGIAVFNFSLREVVPNIQALFGFCNKSEPEIDYFVMHQANRLINETIRKLMRTSDSKWPYSINKYGNTSSASIPLTIVSELKTPLEEKQLNLVLCGFGVGLSWGSAFVSMDKPIVTEVMEM
jgi:3-oxoacyl-[acyl-carrier-protein] synthase-3